MRQDASEILRKQQERDIDKLLKEAREQEFIAHIERLESRYPSFILTWKFFWMLTAAFLTWVFIIWVSCS